MREAVTWEGVIHVHLYCTQNVSNTLYIYFLNAVGAILDGSLTSITTLRCGMTLQTLEGSRRLGTSKLLANKRAGVTW